MVTESLTDANRQLLIVLTTRAWIDIRDDPDMAHYAEECQDIIRKLSGTDTRLYVERAYPSHRVNPINAKFAGENDASETSED